MTPATIEFARRGKWSVMPWRVLPWIDQDTARWGWLSWS